MFDILRKSLSTGVVTRPFPDPAPTCGLNGRGRPQIDFAQVRNPELLAASCATSALSWQQTNGTGNLNFDLGACTFCGLCAEADPAVVMTNDCELAAGRRVDLLTSAQYKSDAGAWSLQNCLKPGNPKEDAAEEMGDQLRERIRKVLNRSLHIREVDAGSCNGCEVEIVGLNSPVYDVERFGIHFVASPRHADMLLVTGPVSRNMELALKKTYDATPDPRLVVAVGACACSGGIFGRNYACLGGVEKVIPVDVFVPGCPPSPRALLHGIFKALGRFTPAEG